MRRVVFKVLILAACMGSLAASARPRQAPMSPDDFLAWVRTSRAKVQTLYVRFTSVVYHLSPQTSDGQREKLFEQHGAWWYMSGGGDERLEFDRANESDDQQETHSETHLWVKADGKATQVSKGSANATAMVDDAKNWKGRNPALPERIFLLEEILEAEDQIRKSFKDEGFEPIGGVRCRKVSFSLNADVPDSPRWVYWIDLERGQPLQRTLEKDGQVLTIVKDVKLAKIGESTWLPVSGRVQGYLPERSRQPASEEVIEFDPSSIKLNEPFPKSTFQIKFEAGTHVVDMVTGKHYFEGAARQLRRSAAPMSKQGAAPGSKQESDRAIPGADPDRRAIEAPSLARSGGRAWLYWVSGLLCAAVLAVAGYMFLQRRVA